MKILLTLLLSLISFSFSQEPVNLENTLFERKGVYYTKDTNKPYSGKVFSLYDDGKIKSEGTLKDGKMMSRTEWKWYENGQERQVEPYKDGKFNGFFKWWYENGQKNFEETYKDGKKDGLSISWHENGQKNFEGTYRDDKRYGLFQWWYENGQKSSERTYKDGELISEKIWNQDGSVIE